MALIDVSNITKSYKVYPSPWARFKEWFLPNANVEHKIKCVIKGVSFTVGEGESVGIIGLNGAGKSTLLKMITGTTKPTAGSIKLAGKVVALLELGMGFHPDFTGRQNIFMAGQLLGMTQKQLEQWMPEIEAFAEIGDYIDQPVRVYSSGMQMRLAFSLATIKRPAILIIDEALSVGDAYFQHKSFERIRQFREKGTTLLIVSHDKAAIQTLCDRAILLDDGIVAMEGAPEHVMDFYNAMIAEHENETVTFNKTDSGKTQTVSGTGEVTIHKAQLLNQSGEIIELADVGQKVRLSIDINVEENINELVLGYVIKDRLGLPVYGTNTHHLKQTLQGLTKSERIHYEFDFDLNLGEGNYSIAIAAHTSDTHLDKNYQWQDLAYVFNVININKQSFVGVTWLPPTMRCRRG